MVGYSFLVTDGPDLGKVFELASGSTLLGRLDAPSTEDPEGSMRWTVTDPAVSRTHAQIDWDGESAPVLIHLSTTNATLLDGRIVTGKSLSDGQSLKAGQSLRLGQTSLEVQEIRLDGGWAVKEDDRAVAFDGSSPWQEDGLLLTAAPDRAQAVLTNQESEAYLLRRLEGTLWSTPLKADTPVVLAVGDIVRLNERRLVITAAE